MPQALASGMQCERPSRPVFTFGDPKSLSIAKNHPKPSQEFSEQFGPSIHKIMGFCGNSPHKVHPNFAQNLGRQILGNTFPGLNAWWTFRIFFIFFCSGEGKGESGRGGGRCFLLKIPGGGGVPQDGGGGKGG